MVEPLLAIIAIGASETEEGGELVLVGNLRETESVLAGADESSEDLARQQERLLMLLKGSTRAASAGRRSDHQEERHEISGHTGGAARRANGLAAAMRSRPASSLVPVVVSFVERRSSSVQVHVVHVHGAGQSAAQ